MPTPEVVHVAVGVIRHSNGDVLLAQRQKGQHLADHWEFPGGKVEADETVLAALARELNEELGIRVQAARPLIRVCHQYAEREVILDTWEVESYSGEPQGCEGQAIQWSPVSRLQDWRLPPADVPIVNALRLPDRYLITPAPPADSTEQTDAYIQRLQTALARGVRLLQLRGADLKGAANMALAERLLRCCEDAGAELLINGDIAKAQQLGAHGVHLQAAQLRQLEQRPLDSGCWVAASCHNAADLRLAESLAADFAVLAPVLPTTTHPQATALGWDAASGLVRDCTIPVFALGGMEVRHIATAWQAGFQGIAAIRGLMPKVQ